MGISVEFDEWFRMEYGRVLSATLIVCGGESQRAEDATAEAFVVAYEKWGDVAHMDAPVAWTIRVAINKANRRWRRSQRRSELEREHVASEVGQPAEADLDLVRALQSLPPRQRESIVLRYLDDLTQREVAAQLGVAPGTAAATIHQAKRNLATTMKGIGRDGN